MSAQKLSELQKKYGELDATDLLRKMINTEFKGKIAVSSSFGADAAVTLALVAEIDPKVPVLFLETGKHFPETLQYVETLTKQLGLQDVRFIKPDGEMLTQIDPNGDLWQTQPTRCCWLRKVRPLENALKEMGIEAIITGRKNYQTSERESMKNIEMDEKGIFKINPLTGWSKEQFKQEFTKRNLPEHLLVAKGYPSIGCAPCTTPVKAGEDERAGRWAHTIKDDGTQKTECGLHVPTNPQSRE